MIKNAHQEITRVTAAKFGTCSIFYVRFFDKCISYSTALLEFVRFLDEQNNLMPFAKHC